MEWGRHFICSAPVKSEKNNGVASTNWESWSANVRGSGMGKGLRLSAVTNAVDMAASQCQGT